jgi:hypothetical protein
MQERPRRARFGIACARSPMESRRWLPIEQYAELIGRVAAGERRAANVA